VYDYITDPLVGSRTHSNQLPLNPELHGQYNVRVQVFILNGCAYRINCFTHKHTHEYRWRGGPADNWNITRSMDI